MGEQIGVGGRGTMLKGRKNVAALRQQDEKIDGEHRSALAEMIDGHEEEEGYTNEEIVIVETGLSNLKLFSQAFSMKDLKMASPLACGKIAYQYGDSHAFGWASTTVRARSA